MHRQRAQSTHHHTFTGALQHHNYTHAAFAAAAVSRVRSLTDDQVSFMIRGFTRLEIPEGELVISQGEAGDHFYIVVSGRYEASLSQLSGEVVAEYGGADSFGELALLYNAPRAATIRCTAGAPGGLASGLHGGVLWALERKRFRHVMVHTNASSLASKAEHFLKSVPMLSALTDAQVGWEAPSLSATPA
jgi:hypothetical protein